MPKDFHRERVRLQPTDVKTPGLRVLVVDDEPAVRRVLATSLIERGFSVLTACDLRSAMHVARTQRPEVILLDVRLGTEDGLELVDLLRCAGLVIPCVVLTGHAGPYEGFKAHELGVVSLIEKPSSPDEIAEILCRVTATVTSGATHCLPTAGRLRVSQHGLQVRPSDQPIGHRMRKAIEYIEASFTSENLSVEDVADYIGVTPEHLSRLFQESLGDGPSTVINELRTRRAQQLLADPRMTLSEIANLCGYRSTRWGARHLLAVLSTV